MGGRKIFRFDNIEEVFGHPTIYYHADQDMKVYGKITEGAALNKGQIRRMGFFRYPTEYTINDLISVNQCAHEFGISNISASSIQINALSRGFSSGKLSENLNIEYPFMNILEFNNLVSFRDNEWRHLIDYRNFIQDVIKENPSANVQDAIDSELAKIGGIIEKSSRSAAKRITEGVGIFAMNAGVAYFSAGLSNLVAAVAAALGGGHFAKNTVPLIIERFSEPEQLQDSKIYYTWKAHKKFSVN